MTAAIYVDALRSHDGKKWCHMFCEDMAALDAFAARIGVPSYRQVPPRAKWPHYDLTPAARQRALSAGAIEADRFTLVEISNKARRRWELQHAPQPSLRLIGGAV